MVGPFWHKGSQAAIGQFTLKALPDGRILVRVFELVALGVFKFLCIDHELRGSVERKVARRLPAQIEMLVEPSVRRHEDTALAPRHYEFFASLRPH